MARIIKHIAFTLAVLITFIGFSALRSLDTRYSRKAWITKVDANNIAYITDLSGHIWTYQTKNFKSYEDVILNMDTQGTEYIDDDIILSIEKES